MTREDKLHTIGGHRHEHVHNQDEEVEEVIPDFVSAYIFDAQYLGEEVPSGFDAVRIPIDGTLKADLSWKKEREIAEMYIDKGLSILWDMDLGLFDQLKYPLDNHTQFLSLGLSLECFRDTLWKQFSLNSIGLSLYRGKLDSNISAAEYFELLAGRLPDTIKCFLFFDCAAIKDPSLLAFSLAKDRYPRFCLGVKEGCRLGGEMAWEGSSMQAGLLSRTFLRSDQQIPSLGVCLPPLAQMNSVALQPLEFVLTKLMANEIPFRIIPESMITAEWEGLDDLIVLSKEISQQGIRKLQGFCAAGGRVVVIGEGLDLSEEINIQNWSFAKNQ